MNITKYIQIKAIKLKNNVLIPFWDKDIVSEDTEMYGQIITYKGYNYHNFVEAIFNLETKQIEKGITVDIYSKETSYKIKEEVLFEVSYKKLKKATIVEIVYEKYDLYIKKGKDLDSGEKTFIENIQQETLYAMKHWTPTYILDNGKKIEYDYQLYHIVK